MRNQEKKLPVFSMYDSLLEIGTTRKFKKGRTIFSEGDKATFLPIVIEGTVKIVRFLEPGKEMILNVFRDGDVFAIPPVLDGGNYPATAIAMEDSRLLLVPRVDFLRMVNERDEFSQMALSTMSKLLNETTSSMTNLATASPEIRVGNVLLRLMTKDGGTPPYKIQFRRRDIADMSGLTTETTIRAIKKLEENNLLRIVQGKIVIDNPALISNFISQY
ncbi:MAG: Crp/Fnr family transcriptional regulator [Pyrinomonadaceae bacterium]